MDNDALDSLDQLEGAVVAVLDRLRRFAPAAIQDGIGGGYFCGRRRILAAHDADQDVQRRPCMAPRGRANFGDGSSSRH
jgi:hypothetical protein